MKINRVHTLVLGSGAAGLAAAVRLRAEGIDDLAILAEGLDQGTSINTGSDKQTYYKQGMYGRESDSPGQLAETYMTAGAAHGDIALTEAAVSTRAFFHLVNLGVPFPQDESGQYIGYKTDHDPRRRATSCGPYTSREMCRALVREAKSRGIPIYENRVAVELVAEETGDRQIRGLLAVNFENGALEAWRADRLVFAVGGPGGLYRASVYPAVHTGAIGLALAIGAKARNLPESQFGLASFTDLSTRNVPILPETNEVRPAPVEQFRWNVSGTFMQVLPKFISTGPDGTSDEREFLRPWFASVGAMNSNVFLKGYQWPFDARKAAGGSSLVDLIVYYETVVSGRRVFLDFRSNPVGTRFDELAPEARDYLDKSEALFGTPLERLKKMNPGAVDLYLDHGIDLAREPLEIRVCAQHNNGGLAGDTWYESENVAGLFPIGEVNGSHGVARPGGSALNAGQVGAFRAAQFIAHAPQPAQSAQSSSDTPDVLLERRYRRMASAIRYLRTHERDWRTERELFQERMSRCGSHLRSATEIASALDDAWRQFESLRLPEDNCDVDNCDVNNCDENERSGEIVASRDTVESLRNIQLCLAHAVYLDAIAFQLASGTGSRGSAITLDPNGETIHPDFPPEWRLVPEDESFRGMVLETIVANGSFFAGTTDDTKRGERNQHCVHKWVPTRPLPHTDDWFEQVWARYRRNDIYRSDTSSSGVSSE